MLNEAAEMNDKTGPKFSFFFSRRFKPFQFSLADAAYEISKLGGQAATEESLKYIAGKYLITENNKQAP